MKNIKIKGGNQFERRITERTIEWCSKRLCISRLKNLKINVIIKPKLNDCYGYCEKIDDTNRSFKIVVENKQSLRNFVMTLVHEMVHVKQYARSEWLMDGEPESWGVQEILTDELWKDNVL